MAPNVIGEDGRPRRSQEPQSWTYVLTHFGTGDRVRICFDSRYDLNPGLARAQKRPGYHFSRDHSYYLDEFKKIFLLLIMSAGGQNDNNK